MYLNCDYCKGYLDEGKNQCDECGYAFGSMDKVSFIDWFDPHDVEHMKAYKHLNTVGMWPKGFIPDNVVMGSNWNILLINKLADCWLDYLLS